MLFKCSLYIFEQCIFFPPLAQLFSLNFFNPTLYLEVVHQDLHQLKLSSNINIMPSNCSRCTHKIQDRLMVRIAVLQVQLQTQSLGKRNLSVGKDETASIPPVSTDSSINLLAESPQPDNFFMASGGKCCRNAQPVSLIQPTETFNRQQVRVRGQAFSGLSSYRYGV